MGLPSLFINFGLLFQGFCLQNISSLEYMDFIGHCYTPYECLL